MNPKLPILLVPPAALLAVLSIATAAQPQTRPVQMAGAAAGLPPLPAVVRDEPAAVTEARLKWFREARFGIFIHWGVYAGPARGEWYMNQGKVPVATYKAYAKDFTAAKYDPQAWAQLFADAGAKYMVITCKHHDGFVLFDSAVSDWNAVKASGAKRDLIQPLVEAVRAKGLKFGAYYSQSQDWNNLGGGKGNTQPWDEEQKKGDFDTYLKTISLPQVKEIMDKFHPDILWWDTEYSMMPERAKPFFDYVCSVPNVIINSRLGGGVLGDFRTSEQRIPAAGQTGRPLEVNMTINNSWGFNANDLNWKSSQTLIRNISDIASKDGNYLLNIGPMADGTIPQPEVDRLLAMGKWLKTNGEAIYATRGGIYVQTPAWGRTTQKVRPDGGTTLYVHVWTWPADGKVLLTGVKAAPRSGKMLVAEGGGAAVTSALTTQGLVLTLPGAAPDPDASVAALEFAGPVPMTNAATLPQDSGASGTLVDPGKSPPQ